MWSVNSPDVIPVAPGAAALSSQMTAGDVALKVCRKCGLAKPFDEFYDDTRKDGKAAKDGKKPSCKPCWSAGTAADGRANPQRRAEASRRYRQSHPDRRNNTEQDYEKRKAWWTVNWAVRTGKLIVPKLCERCGKARKLHGHHDDYSKPLDVEWLCATCHKAHHLSMGSV